MRSAVATLVLLSSLTFFLGLGRQAITDSDEGFYAEAAREMVEGGDWLTPHFNYEDRWQKPILYYWLTAATFLVAGENEAAARLWSALAGLGLVILTWSAARTMMSRNEQAAWLAGAIVATCAGYFAMARLALPDLPLTFFITLTIWAALQHRWVMTGVATGLGFLMKGPVALVIPALVLLPIWWREGAFVATGRAHVRARDLAVAAAIGAAISLPWYLAMTLEHGSAYLQSFFVGDNLERFATDRFNEPRAFWFYLPILAAGVMPWSAYLIVLPCRPAMDVLRRRRRLTDDEWRLLLWAVLPLLFFTISIGKQPRYILPVLPPVAILLAHAMSTRIADLRRGAALAAATWTTVALFAAEAAFLYRAQTLFIGAYPALTVTGIIVTAAGAVALGWIAASRAWSRLPPVAAACAVSLLLSMQFGALAGVRPEPVEQMAALVKQHRQANEPVGTYQAFVRNLVFYTRFKQVELYDEAVALDFLKSPGRVLLVARAADLPRLQALAGVSVRLLARLDYLNAAGVRLRTILSPLPEQDFETVVLVANR